MMTGDIRLLLALDESEASKRAISYVASIVGGSHDVCVRLFHVLPHLPPAALEWGGTANAAKERKYLDDEKARFIGEAEEKAQPAVDEAKAILREAGVPEQSIETELYPSVATTDIADKILYVAKRDNFDTVVLGRESWSWLKETVRHHLCHEVIKKGVGITVWVVE